MPSGIVVPCEAKGFLSGRDVEGEVERNGMSDNDGSGGGVGDLTIGVIICCTLCRVEGKLSLSEGAWIAEGGTVASSFSFPLLFIFLLSLCVDLCTSA